ncbi:hypothetical protein AU255_08575 [Methyloprofundus sedimenti]|uniref:Glycosyltransferase 2-like domain-containing protein n=1 Tax=Methyloprofundus sedimenti TaxID=1420851 RepID=A0A1V8M8H7_9GAMM|nr:glycosyltransferase family 2 protein [Methyloprofundus sedimenti]OQK17900.1 hypothetical protein AU255_08575 [Methyloprofundus sedimenti]
MNKKVSIILLNYNGFEDSIDCFQSLQQISYENYDIVIVDNASPDVSMDRLHAYMQVNEIEHIFFEKPESAMLGILPSVQVTLIQSGQNNGYGHGNNIGIKYALNNGADYVLVLNNDTVVEPDFLEPMVQMCENDKSIGIASGKIYFYDRPDTIWFNGGKFTHCTAKAKHFHFNEKDVGQIPQEPITFISGCMWLIPKKVFNDVGFINEDYFMYVEDLEFCRRVIRQGYTLKIADKSHILHKVGSSSGHWSVFFAYWMSRNKIKFIKDFEVTTCSFIAYIYHIFYTSIWWLLHKRFDLFKAHLRGIYSVFISEENK